MKDVETVLNHPHELQLFWDLAGSQVKMAALEMALSLEVFDYLQQGHSVDDVANYFGLEQAKTAIWLDLLWSMQCLEKSEPSDVATIYWNSKVTNQYLVTSSTTSYAKGLLHRFRVLKQFSDRLIEGGLQQGRVSEHSDVGALWAKAAEEQIYQEQRAVTVPTLQALLKEWEGYLGGWPTATRFLDLGGGAGLISITVARAIPEASVTLFDLPETIRVARRHIHMAGLSDRIETLSGNLNEALPHGQYDVIWCSSVLHFVDSPAEVLNKVFDQLAPEGILVLAHAELSEQRGLSEKVLPFYMPMLLQGKYLPKQGELTRQLSLLGAQHMTSCTVASFPMAPVQLHCYRKGAK